MTMGEYEPRDSRNVTQSTHQAPGEPKRTGPREQESRPFPDYQQPQQGELTEDQRGEDGEATVAVEQQQEQRTPGDRALGERPDRND
jgi:hypothetical protein